MGMHAAFAVIARDPNDKVIELNYGRIKVGSALALKAWAIRVACSTAARMHEDFPGNFRIRACTILLSNPPLSILPSALCNLIHMDSALQLFIG